MVAREEWGNRELDDTQQSINTIWDTTINEYDCPMTESTGTEKKVKFKKWDIEHNNQFRWFFYFYASRNELKF